MFDRVDDAPGRPEAELDAAVRATLTVFELTGDQQMVTQLREAHAHEHEALLRFVCAELERLLPEEQSVIASLRAAWPKMAHRTTPSQ